MDTNRLEINKEFIENSIKEINRTDIEWDAMPYMQLYMDQLQSFLDEKVGRDLFKRTLINNYTKRGLLKEPINTKKYNQEHIALLILINHLKSILSLEDIQALLDPIINAPDKYIGIKEIYNNYLEMKEDAKEAIIEGFETKFKTVQKNTQKIPDDKDQDLAEAFLTVMMLIAEANIAKGLAEAIINNFFKKNDIPSLDDEKTNPAFEMEEHKSWDVIGEPDTSNKRRFIINFRDDTNSY